MGHELVPNPNRPPYNEQVGLLNEIQESHFKQLEELGVLGIAKAALERYMTQPEGKLDRGLVLKSRVSVPEWPKTERLEDICLRLFFKDGDRFTVRNIRIAELYLDNLFPTEDFTDLDAQIVWGMINSLKTAKKSVIPDLSPDLDKIMRPHTFLAYFDRAGLV